MAKLEDTFRCDPTLFSLSSLFLNFFSTVSLSLLLFQQRFLTLIPVLGFKTRIISASKTSQTKIKAIYLSQLPYIHRSILRSPLIHLHPSPIIHSFCPCVRVHLSFNIFCFLCHFPLPYSFIIFHCLKYGFSSGLFLSLSNPAAVFFLSFLFIFLKCNFLRRRPCRTANYMRCVGP